jgi:hypothetical protein
VSRLRLAGHAYLGDPRYNVLRLKLEMAHAAVEARRRVRLNEGQ